jgi:hypothetical protein
MVTCLVVSGAVVRQRNIAGTVWWSKAANVIAGREREKGRGWDKMQFPRSLPQGPIGR